MDMNPKLLIRSYQIKDFKLVIELFRYEGEDWKEYYDEKALPRIRKMLKESNVYLLFSDTTLIGMIRTKPDFGLGVYIYDLLVSKEYRGHRYGQKLIEYAKKKTKNQALYVMSDEDGYYEKLGYKKIGSIFEIEVKKD